MDDASWRRIRSIFERILELPEEEQMDRLERCCEGEPALKEELSKLLRHHRDSRDFLEPEGREPLSRREPRAQ